MKSLYKSSSNWNKVNDRGQSLPTMSKVSTFTPVNILASKGFNTTGVYRAESIKNRNNDPTK